MLFSAPSPQARMNRIGELLARAVARKCRREEIENAQSKRSSIKETSDPIVLFIAQVGEVSSKDVQERFSFSRATAFRRLKSLQESGFVVRSGSTKSCKYKVA